MVYCIEFVIGSGAGCVAGTGKDMTKMKKRILSMLLGLVLVLGMLPVVASAYTIPDYDESKHPIVFHEGRVTYGDIANTNTLQVDGVTVTGDSTNGYIYTLNNVNISKSSSTALVVYGTNITIKLIGDNVIESIYESSTSSTISVAISVSGNLTITGSGTLTAIAGDAEESIGIRLNTYDTGTSRSGLFSTLTIKSGKVNALGGKAFSETSGISTNGGSIYVNGGILNATGGEISNNSAYSYGISSQNAMINVNGGKLVLNGASLAIQGGTTIKVDDEIVREPDHNGSETNKTFECTSDSYIPENDSTTPESNERFPSDTYASFTRTMFSLINRPTPVKADNGSVKVRTALATFGKTISLTVTPDAGYELAELLVIDARGSKIPVSDLHGGNYSFKMPAYPVTITPVFQPIPAEEEAAEVVEAAADAVVEVSAASIVK